MIANELSEFRNYLLNIIRLECKDIWMGSSASITKTFE